MVVYPSSVAALLGPTPSLYVGGLYHSQRRAYPVGEVSVVGVADLAGHGLFWVVRTRRAASFRFSIASSSRGSSLFTRRFYAKSAGFPPVATLEGSGSLKFGSQQSVTLRSRCDIEDMAAEE